MTGGFEQFFEEALRSYGTLALFVTLTLETFGAPLPGESALIIAASAAATGTLDIWTVAIAAFCAAVLGTISPIASGGATAGLLSCAQDAASD